MPVPWWRPGRRAEKALAEAQSVFDARLAYGEKIRQDRVAALEGEIARLDAELAAKDDLVRSVLTELRHTATTRLPELAMSTAHPHVVVPGLRDAQLAGSDVDVSLGHVLEQVRQLVVDERVRGDDAAKAVMRGVMGKLQALHYRQQTFLQGMQERYDHPDVAEDLVRLDELNELNLRLVQGLAVMCGRWPGLARGDSPVQGIVKSAAGRVVGYQRIAPPSYQVRGRLGVVARAVEPLAMVLAELLDNALSHSPSNIDIEVEVKHGASGCTFFITDWGLGMEADELARANGLAAGELALLFTELEGEPPGIGLPVAGAIARQYGLRTVLERAPYSNGLRAAVFVPESLLIMVKEDSVTPSVVSPNVPSPRGPVPGDEEQSAPTSADALASVAVLPPGPSGLPQRRGMRGRVPGPVGVPDAADAPEPSPAENQSRWAAVQSGTAAGRAAPDQPDHPSEEGQP
ncbi:ATP-binding protein [Streptomyces liangshanensis]|uniref:histidine kinase n=1 Tax=Streptomyces liangshanensis TaxID=2717324 RepID=A0A6G9H4N7_9ACTN|nr:ATP-binding protein [Streptomyces liangshanensis]QIQ05414.1 sensor histidine kinase [Streptomyces liangshanensis]